MLYLTTKKSCALSYTSLPYSEVMAMRPAVTYTLHATSLKEQTGDVITFAQFQAGEILTKTLNDAESGDKYHNKSIMMSKKDVYAINYGDGSNHYPISTDMLDNICDGSQTHPNVNIRFALY